MTCHLQVKIWNVQSGFCFVTFSDHTAAVPGVAFLPSGSVVVSASLAGTVRAFDLVRYRNFRTMTAPHPVQFGSLAVDPAGEVTFNLSPMPRHHDRLFDEISPPLVFISFRPSSPSLILPPAGDAKVEFWL